MFSMLKNRLGVPGIIAVAALVFAMIGGAYAANNSGGGGSEATASATGKRGPRGPKGPKGPQGPQGPIGLPGANGKDGAAGGQGPKGDPGSNGTNGANGTNGTNGKTVLNGTGAPSAGTGTDGDFYIDTAADAIYGPKTAGAWGSATPLKGETGFTETLPSGKTLTGTWAAQTGPTGFAFVPIPFNIPLAEELDAANVVLVKQGEKGELGKCSNSASEEGTVAKPYASNGYLCVYIGKAVPVAAEKLSLFFIRKPTVSGATAGAGRTGAYLSIFSEEPVNVSGWGTYAVTAP